VPEVHEIKISPAFFQDVDQTNEPMKIRVLKENHKVGDCVVLQKYENGIVSDQESINIITYMIGIGNYGIDKLYNVLVIRPIQEHEYQQFENNN